MVRLWPRSKSQKTKSTLPDVLNIEISDGFHIDIALRPNIRARRLSLRYDAISGQMRLSCPPHIHLDKLEKFAKDHRDWITKQITKHPEKQMLKHDDLITILGKSYVIFHHADRLRGLTEIIDDQIHIYGEESQVNRKLTQFLKKHAKEMITPRAHGKAAQIGKKVNGITIKDTHSRWGSCSSAGHLSFSWRLVMAPDDVFDYVIAHEVAHLEHMDHSPDFWRLCASLTPHATASKAWLKHSSQLLYRL